MLFLGTKLRKKNKEHLTLAYVDFISTVMSSKSYFSAFQYDRMSALDDAPPGDPKEAPTEDNVTKVSDFVLADYLLKMF